MKKEISVVIPIYKCKDCIQELYIRLIKSIKPITENFEIIFVDDNCPENSWELISDLSEKDKKIIGIQLSKNFGQHNAITAGLDFTKGKYIIVMDGDLQDRPEEIPHLYKKIKENYDFVVASRTKRKDNIIKKINSWIYYKILDYFSGTQTDISIANFGIYSEKVILNFRKLREQNRNFPLSIKWLGYNSTSIAVEHSERHSGNTSYTFRKLIDLAVDSIVSQSNRPLKLSIKFGFLLSFSAIIYALYNISKYYIFGIAVEGWTSIIVSLYFLSGLIFANLGILGLYIGKIFNETKNRPLYAIKEITENNYNLN